MIARALGNTGIFVSALGLGAGHIGGDDLTDEDAERLLDRVLDLGVTLIDTARSYGRSEERIARVLARRRDDVILSTKGGYGLQGVEDWTFEAIRRGIDEALSRLRTDRIDVFHLHSCPIETLRHGEVIDALDDAKRAGKIRVAAYSGENEALDFAIDSGRFGAVQCSVNVCDQRALDGAVPRAHERGVGVIGKRPIANAPWRFDQRPRGDYAETYWTRLAAMDLDVPREEWPDVALRFSAHAPCVSSVIVGTKRLEHLEADVAILEKGALSPEMAARLRDAFRAHDDGWRGEI